MRQSHKFLATIDSSFYRRYLQPLLVMAGVLLFSLVSSSVFALEINPGSNAICSAGATKGFLSDGSYNSLISSYRNESYQTVISQTTRTGSTNANIPLKIKMSINDFGINNTGNNTTITGTTDNPAIDINRNFIRQTSLSDISLEFQDSDNGKVIYLNKVAVSVFDIDKNVSGRRGWDDLVKITGINENNEPIPGRLQTISTSKVIDENGLQTSSTSNLNCTAALDSECQGSVLFDEPVKSVTLSYGNTNNVTSPTTQKIQFRLDSYCYKPPKIIVNKLLDGSRVDGDDQFRIELRRTDNNDFVEAFTTTGSNDVVTDNTTTVTTLTEGVNYTVSEQIINGNLLDYQTTYTCSNATTGTDVVFSSGEMPVNADGTRRTFAINNVSYGDEITCNVTNTPSQYTFSGTVFNDNGGISSNDKFDTSSTFTGNSAYFNGIYDRSVESGINDINVQIRLTNCSDTTYATASINEEGKYSFSFPSNFISVGQSGCVVQDEPNEWTYSVDTTANEIPITITEGNYTYDNLNFGEVQINNTALVLEKQQYVHDCSATLNYSSILDNETDPSLGFSEVTAKVDPGQCIAYKITATNRGNIVLNNIVISDTLQKEGVDGDTVTSTLADAISTADGFATDRAIGYNGTITTQPFSLNKEAPRSFYFNTQYGTSNSNTP